MGTRNGEKGMNAIIRDKTGKLAELCGKYHVKRLELFGSAATEGAFNPDVSDIDFIVEFGPCSPEEHCDHYFGLLEELERLYDRHVDLVELKAMKNPYFIKEANESRVLIYGA